MMNLQGILSVNYEWGYCLKAGRKIIQTNPQSTGLIGSDFNECAQDNLARSLSLPNFIIIKGLFD